MATAVDLIEAISTAERIGGGGDWILLRRRRRFCFILGFDLIWFDWIGLLRSRFGFTLQFSQSCSILFYPVLFCILSLYDIIASAAVYTVYCISFLLFLCILFFQQLTSQSWRNIRFCFFSRDPKGHRTSESRTKIFPVLLPQINSVCATLSSVIVFWFWFLSLLLLLLPVASLLLLVMNEWMSSRSISSSILLSLLGSKVVLVLLSIWW